MKVTLLRHGMTAANEKRLYCGRTDIPLSEGGKRGLAVLKESIAYPDAAVYITSGLARTNETLRILYGREPDSVIDALKEIDFGDWEMKSYDELKDLPAYQNWIGGGAAAPCPNGESRGTLKNRAMAGLYAIAGTRSESAVAVCHGGVISVIMETLFPGVKNFYEWQPDFGRGYTLNISGGRAALVSDV